MEQNNHTFWREFADKDEQARIHNEWTDSVDDNGSDPNGLAAMLLTECDTPNYPEERVEQYIKSLQDYVNSNQETQDEHEYWYCNYQETQDEHVEEHKLLRNLIKQCAEAAAVKDTKKAYSLIEHLRLKASPKGNPNERLAHHFAEALVARITDTGSLLCKALSTSLLSMKEYFSAFQVVPKVTPMSGLPVFFTNQTILDEAANAGSIHVISYGIGHGFLYLCLIKDLSERPGGPPKLRITGVDFPNHPWNVPVEELQSKLVSFAKEVGVSLEFNCVMSENWHNIQPAQLKVRSANDNEVLFVVCVHRLRQVYDEPGLKDSPRKQLLSNIRRMKPRIFILASYTVSCNSPSLVSRAMEYFDYLSAVFDSFEATVPRERVERQLMEMSHGLDLLYNLACEGTDRKERPESHKHWQSFIENAGFKQNMLRPDVNTKCKEMVGTYHKNFKLTTDGDSMLISWKNHLLGAITAWKVKQT